MLSERLGIHTQLVVPPELLVKREGFVVKKDVDSTGLQSDVEVGEYDGMPAIRKVAGKHLDQDTLQQMALTSVIQRQQMAETGILIPHNFVTHVNGGLEVIDELVLTQDVEQDIKERDYTGYREVIKYICTLNDGTVRSKVMFDAMPGNFAHDEDGLHFFDFFPPTLRGSDGGVTPYYEEVFVRPRDLFTFNYGDTRGQLTKLMAGNRYRFPEHEEQLEEIALSTIQGRVPREVERYINEQAENNYPDMNTFYQGQAYEAAELLQTLI